MTDVTRAIDAISKAAERLGLPELARRAAVPYTTLTDWKTKNFRPKAIETFEKLSAAADTLLDDEAA